MGGPGSGQPKRYDFNTPKDRQLGISAYVLSNGRYHDDKNNPLHKGMASRLGLSTDMLKIYRDAAPGFDSACEEALLAEDFNLRQKAIKGCFNKQGEIIAEKVLTRLLESRGILEKEQKNPLAAIQMNSGGGGIQVAFVEPKQLTEASDGETD